MKSKDFELVWVAQGYLDAQLKKNYLIAHGIEPVLYEESLGTLYGFTNTPLGEVEIYVPVKQSKRALELLNDLLDQEPGEEGE